MSGCRALHHASKSQTSHQHLIASRDISIVTYHILRPQDRHLSIFHWMTGSRCVKGLHGDLLRDLFRKTFPYTDLLTCRLRQHSKSVLAVVNSEWYLRYSSCDVSRFTSFTLVIYDPFPENCGDSQILVTFRVILNVRIYTNHEEKHLIFQIHEFAILTPSTTGPPFAYIRCANNHNLLRYCRDSGDPICRHTVLHKNSSSLIAVHIRILF